MPPFDVIGRPQMLSRPLRLVAVVPDEVLEPLVVVPVKEATPDELMVRHTPKHHRRIAHHTGGMSGLPLCSVYWLRSG